eukprot:3694115-Ditylum_brightwellii.AAC.1
MSNKEKLGELEAIDSSLTSAMLGPEKRIHIPHRVWWSNTIRHAHILVQYWKTKFSLEQNQQEDESILDEIRSKLGPDIDIFQGDPLQPT